MTTSTTPEIKPEPKWEVLNLVTLKKAAAEILKVKPKKRTLKGAYAELLEVLRTTGRELTFTCQTCDSLIDDEMPRCWACGLVFTGESEEDEVVDAELVARAKRLGIDPGELDRAALLKKIEEAETKARAARTDADLARLESKRLNVKITEDLPDGWRKKESKQYTSYFDSSGTRRIAIWHRGLRVDFSVDDGFYDGFPQIEFFDASERKKRHYGRTNYVYNGDTIKTTLDLVKRCFGKY
jgi:hypothetical protein